MNNNWNQIIYKAWSPFYDCFFNQGIFLKARKKVFEQASFAEKSNVLFLGVGTGVDLELVDYSNLEVTAIDYSSAMLNKARKKFAGSSIAFMEMDAQHLTFPDNSYDYIVASLILSVVPDPDKCLEEMKRVLKPDGRIFLFDKFILQDSIPLAIRLARPLIILLGTDPALNVYHLETVRKKELIITDDQPVMLNGMYRMLTMEKYEQ